jgi:hypothetical protein
MLPRILLPICIAAAAAVAAEHEAGQQRIEALTAQLEVEPENQAARRELLVLYVVDRDDPGSARRYSSQVDDELWKDCVLLASRDIRELREDDLLKAGLWYRGLASKARGPARLAMYERARAFYERYLEVHTREDEERAQAQSILRSVVAMIKTLERMAQSPAVSARHSPRTPDSTSTAPDVQSDLVVHLDFDRPPDEGQPIPDAAGNGRNGRLIDGQMTDSPRGRALRGQVVIPDSSQLRHEGSYSIALWLHAPALDPSAAIIDKTHPQGRGGRQYHLCLGSDGRSPATVAGGTGGAGQLITASQPLPVERWTHLVLTQRFDGRQTHVNFYINGAPAGGTSGSSAAPGKTFNAAADLTIGQAQAMLDDLRIYHRALTAAEAADLYRLDALPSQDAPLELAELPEAPSPPPHGRQRPLPSEPENARSSSEFFGIKIR